MRFDHYLLIYKAKMIDSFWTKDENSGHSVPQARSGVHQTDCYTLECTIQLRNAGYKRNPNHFLLGK